MNGLLELLAVTDPISYLASLGLEPFPWQVEVLETPANRVLLLCARQSGKSTIVAGKVGHRVRYQRNAEHIIVCPSQDQSKLVMRKLEQFVLADVRFPIPTNDSVFEKYWGKSRQRVIALPGSERSVRGYSDPATIIADEASRIQDDTYRAFRPWMTGGKTDLIAMTTPFGKRGWFWEAWEQSDRWHKILVRVAWEVRDGRLVPAMPEDEFKAYWAERGVSAHYSPRHTREWCEEELDEIGEFAFRQEYCCEFLDVSDQFFSHDMIQRALVDDEAIGNVGEELLEDVEKEWTL